MPTPPPATRAGRSVRLLPRSLQGRLLLLVLSVVTVVWLSAAAKTWFDVRHELDELLDSHLAQAAALLVAQQSHELEDSDDDEDHHAGSPPATLSNYAPKVAFQVFHEDALVQRSANAPAEPMVQLGEHFRAGFRTVEIDGVRWRVYAAFGAERDVQVYVGEQQESRTSILQAVLRSTLLPIALALPLLALAIAWAVARGVAPLRSLGHTLTQRQPQALQAIDGSGVATEIRPVIDALNGLFERIGALMEAERRFTGDAAHELRTPIAAIRTQAQVALGAYDNPAERQHALQATLQGCDRATRLVEQLLTLARLESAAAPLTTVVDLAALARRAAAEAAPDGMARGLTLAVEVASTAEAPAQIDTGAAGAACRVLGDETLLAVLLRNLIDNALRYSPAGAQVSISVQRQGDSVRLSVADSGPGMAPADRARLGERFFRVLGSGQPGSGLGWSIVRRIAAVHQARVQVQRSESLGGLEVLIDWPAA